LGGVVRTLQNDRADPRRDRRTVQGKVRIAKLNIDENPATPPKFNIRGIPTLILFKNGTVEAQKVGAVTKSQLAAFLDSNL
jgi:thioredoxin 1